MTSRFVGNQEQGRPVRVPLLVSNIRVVPDAGSLHIYCIHWRAKRRDSVVFAVPLNKHPIA